jgi:DNA-binding Xre family transcriptional regulator
MKWNLRLAAAQRDIWKASQLQAMLADAGLVISAGKMSHLWSSQPVTIRLQDLQIICTVLGCTPNDLLVLEETHATSRPLAEPAPLRAAAGDAPIRRRHTGRAKPPV